MPDVSSPRSILLSRPQTALGCTKFLFSVHSTLTEENNDIFLTKIKLLDKKQNENTQNFFSEKRDSTLYTEQNSTSNLLIANNDEVFDLKEGICKCDVNQYGFAYFQLNIRNKLSPIRIDFINLTQIRQLKIYYSTKTRKPNYFNCQDFREGKSVLYFDPVRASRFSEDKLYLTVFTEFKIRLTIRIDFFKEKKQSVVVVNTEEKEKYAPVIEMNLEAFNARLSTKNIIFDSKKLYLE